MTGNRMVPKSVDAAVPTTAPLSFALFETAKLRPARFGNPTMPPFRVQVNAWLPPVRIDRPTAIPPCDTPKPWEAVSPGSITPMSKI
jgi:hypothetical protein